MKTVDTNVKYEESASRAELIIRFLWAIPLTIVLYILAIVGSVAWCVQWLVILVTAKRNKTLNEWILKMFDYSVKYSAYQYLLTDERPPIMPES